MTWVIGRSAPPFYYNIVSDRDGAPGFAHALVRTASPSATEAILPAPQRSLPAQAPGVQVLVRGLVQGPPVDAPVELRIVGPEMAILREEGTHPAVPLSAVSELRLDPGEGTITRRNGERANTVQAFLLHWVLPEEALADIRASLAAQDFALPPGYRLEVGGDSDARSSTLDNLLAPLGLIVALSIAVVVMTFRSFRLAAVALVVRGLSAGLSMLALAVFQYPFGINAIIGLIGAIGVSINAALIILTALQEYPAASQGAPDAMADVVMDSARHIVSTTLTTFGGFLPLIVAGGGFWPPFAMAVAGGVLLSGTVSFYFSPAAFRLVRPGRARNAPSLDAAPRMILQAAE